MDSIYIILKDGFDGSIDFENTILIKILKKFKNKEKENVFIMDIEEHLLKKFKTCNIIFSTCYYILDYHPYRKRGEENPNFDDISRAILGFKKGKYIENVGDLFYKRFFEVIKENPNICLLTVPSHDGSESSMQKMLVYLSKKYNVITYPYALGRKHPIEKLSNGGCRDSNIIRESLELKEIPKEDNIFLLDDVTTSGNSLFTTESFLWGNIPDNKKIFCIALSKTADD